MCCLHLKIIDIFLCPYGRYSNWRSLVFFSIVSIGLKPNKNKRLQHKGGTGGHMSLFYLTVNNYGLWAMVKHPQACILCVLNILFMHLEEHLPSANGF